MAAALLVALGGEHLRAEAFIRAAGGEAAIFAAAPASGGGIWAATYSELRHFTSAGAQSYTFPQNYNVTSVVVLADEVLLGTSSGLLRKPITTNAPIAEVGEFGGGRVNALLRISQTEAWIGSKGGIYRYRSGTASSTSPVWTGGAVSALALVQDQSRSAETVWAASSQSLLPFQLPFQSGRELSPIALPPVPITGPVPHVTQIVPLVSGLLLTTNTANSGTVTKPLLYYQYGSSGAVQVLPDADGGGPTSSRLPESWLAVAVWKGSLWAAGQNRTLIRRSARDLEEPQSHPLTADQVLDEVSLFVPTPDRLWIVTGDQAFSLVSMPSPQDPGGPGRPDELLGSPTELVVHRHLPFGRGLDMEHGALDEQGVLWLWGAGGVLMGSQKLALHARLKGFRVAGRSFQFSDELSFEDASYAGMAALPTGWPSPKFKVALVQCREGLEKLEKDESYIPLEEFSKPLADGCSKVTFAVRDELGNRSDLAEVRVVTLPTLKSLPLVYAALLVALFAAAPWVRFCMNAVAALPALRLVRALLGAEWARRHLLRNATRVSGGNPGSAGGTAPVAASSVVAELLRRETSLFVQETGAVDAGVFQHLAHVFSASQERDILGAPRMPCVIVNVDGFDNSEEELELSFLRAVGARIGTRDEVFLKGLTQGPLVVFVHGFSQLKEDKQGSLIAYAKRASASRRFVIHATGDVAKYEEPGFQKIELGGEAK